MQQKNVSGLRHFEMLVVDQFAEKADLRVISDVQHDPNAIDNLAAAVGVE